MLEKLDKLADRKDVVGRQIVYHFNKGLIVKSPEVNGIFFDILKEKEELILFIKDSSYVKVIPKEDYSNTEIHLSD